MNENIKTRLADFIKWVLIIIIAAIAFYIVCPKYHFENSRVRCNKVTGKVEICKVTEDNWKTQGKN